jgi:hypothetical protein
MKINMARKLPREDKLKKMLVIGRNRKNCIKRKKISQGRREKDVLVTTRHEPYTQKITSIGRRT